MDLYPVHPCVQCGKRFASKERLARHMFTHNPLATASTATPIEMLTTTATTMTSVAVDLAPPLRSTSAHDAMPQLIAVGMPSIEAHSFRRDVATGVNLPSAATAAVTPPLLLPPMSRTHPPIMRVGLGGRRLQRRIRQPVCPVAPSAGPTSAASTPATSHCAACGRVLLPAAANTSDVDLCMLFCKACLSGPSPANGPSVSPQQHQQQKQLPIKASDLPLDTSYDCSIIFNA